MRWYAKEQSLPFDDLAFGGLFYLDGDAGHLAERNQWIRGRKSPQLLFPSGLAFEVWGTNAAIFVNVFGTLDVPLHSDRETVLHQLLLTISNPDYMAYMVFAIATSQIFIRGAKADDQLLVTYHERSHRLENIERL